MIFEGRIYLKLMEEKDIVYKVQWMNDPDVRRTLDTEYPISEIATRQWLEKAAQDPSRKDFIFYLDDNDYPIGCGGLQNIDRKNSKAEIFMIIGRKDYWGKGYAGDIRKALLDYAFNELGLNKVYSYVWSENEAMINLNKKFGFQTEGLLRDHKFTHGEYRHMYLMAVLKREYLNG